MINRLDASRIKFAHSLPVPIDPVGCRLSIISPDPRITSRYLGDDYPFPYPIRVKVRHLLVPWIVLNDLADLSALELFEKEEHRSITALLSSRRKTLQVVRRLPFSDPRSQS
ncbi:hypothetical protein PALA111701_02970 [Paenibacillus lactis]